MNKRQMQDRETIALLRSITFNDNLGLSTIQIDERMH
ncbi:hypothetical protein NUACC26_040960 [Scytonema sp. NUACC26]